MSLVEADTARLEAQVGFPLRHRGHSAIEPAVSAADRAAAVWIRALDQAFRRRAGKHVPPVWLYETFKWGPHPWPVRWSEIPHLPYTDCGLMAALSTAVYRARGAHVMPVQLVLKFNPESTRGWSGLWRNSRLRPHWCTGIYAYHEGTAVIEGDHQCRIWDPLGRFWLPLRSDPGYEGIVALRLVHDTDDSMPLPRLAGSVVSPDRWMAVKETAKASIDDPTNDDESDRSSKNHRFDLVDAISNGKRALRR